LRLEEISRKLHPEEMLIHAHWNGTVALHDITLWKVVHSATVPKYAGYSLFVCLVFNGTFSAYRLYRATDV